MISPSMISLMLRRDRLSSLTLSGLSALSALSDLSRLSTLFPLSILLRRYTIHSLLVVSSALLGACSDVPDPRESELNQVEKGFYLSSSLWERDEIGVCWENIADVDVADRTLMQRSIAESWSAYSPLSFTGWGACRPDSSGIRIRVADLNPSVSGLGRAIDGRESGMSLNTTFRAWGSPCTVSARRRELCIRALAVHEFGHALGFAHEQNRPDTPTSCQDAPQGRSGDIIVGSWDLRSVMNYCNPTYANNGSLSAGDIAMVQRAYGVKEGAEITPESTPTAQEPNPAVTPETPETASCQIGMSAGVCRDIATCDGLAVAGHCPGTSEIQCCLPEPEELSCRGLALCLNECRGSDPCLSSCARAASAESITLYNALAVCYQDAECSGRCAPCQEYYTACGL